MTGRSRAAARITLASARTAALVAARAGDGRSPVGRVPRVLLVGDIALATVTTRRPRATAAGAGGVARAAPARARRRTSSFVSSMRSLGRWPFIQ